MLLAELPCDIHTYLLRFLDYSSICSLICTSSYFRNLPTHKDFQRALLALELDAESNQTPMTERIRVCGARGDHGPLDSDVPIYPCYNCLEIRLYYYFPASKSALAKAVDPNRICLGCLYKIEINRDLEASAHEDVHFPSGELRSYHIHWPL
jgi:hypothetical protein